MTYIHVEGGEQAVRLYLNGILVETRTWTGDCETDEGDHRFLLGNEFGVDRAWLGTFYRVAVYDRPLNSDEVEDNYNAGP